MVSISFGVSMERESTIIEVTSFCASSFLFFEHCDILVTRLAKSNAAMPTRMNLFLVLIFSFNIEFCFVSMMAIVRLS